MDDKVLQGDSPPMSFNIMHIVFLLGMPDEGQSKASQARPQDPMGLTDANVGSKSASTRPTSGTRGYRSTR